MTKAQYDRGTAMLRRQMDQHMESIRQPRMLGLEQEVKNLTSDLVSAKETISVLSTQLAQLHLEIEKLTQSHSAQTAGLNKEIETATANADKWHKHYVTAMRRVFSLDNAHKRASAVLRMFTPSQVQNAREDAREAFPHLWTDETMPDQLSYKEIAQ